MRPVLALALACACTGTSLAGIAWDMLYNDRVTIAPSGYAGGTTAQQNFPLLVRLSESCPSGFSYVRTYTGGADLCFVDQDGTILDYDVDTWDTSGTSLVWVRVPKLTEKTAITVYWGPRKALTEIQTATGFVNDSTKVWVEYAAVWHLAGLDVESGKAVNAAGNALLDAYFSNALGQGSPIAGGPVGLAFDVTGGDLVAADYGSLLTDGVFTFSGWYRNRFYGAADPLMFCGKKFGQTADTDPGWAWTADGLNLMASYHGNSASPANGTFASPAAWNFLAVSRPSAAKVLFAVNGEVRSTTESASLIDDNAFLLQLGTANFALDEVRIAKAGRTALWLEAEYAQVSNEAWCAFSDFYTTGDDIYPEQKDVPGDSRGGSDLITGGGGVSWANFAYRATLMVDGLPDGQVLTNFPFLVRLRADQPAGFSYDKMDYGCEDLRFVKPEGGALAHDVDTWDESGTSLVWVRLPLAQNGTQFVMCWGQLAGSSLPVYDPAGVWSAYAGVWHFGEEIGAAAATTVSADSAGGGYDAVPKAGAAGDYRAAMTSEAGILGRARVNDNGARTGGNRLELAGSSALELGSSFTFSGWMRYGDIASAPLAASSAAARTATASAATPAAAVKLAAAGATETPELDANYNLKYTGKTVIVDNGGKDIGEELSASKYSVTLTDSQAAGLADGGHCLWIENSDVTLTKGAYLFNEFEIVGEGSKLTVGDGAHLDLAGKGSSSPRASQGATVATTLCVTEGGSVSVDSTYMIGGSGSDRVSKMNVAIDGGTLTLSGIPEKSGYSFKSIAVSNGGSYTQGKATSGQFNSILTVDDASFSAGNELIVHGDAKISVKGANAKVTVSGGIKIDGTKAPEFNFTLPEAGWRTAPVAAKCTITSAAVKFAVDTTDYRIVAGATDHVPLISGSSLAVPAEVLSNAVITCAAGVEGSLEIYDSTNICVRLVSGCHPEVGSPGPLLLSRKRHDEGLATGFELGLSTNAAHNTLGVYGPSSTGWLVPLTDLNASRDRWVYVSAAFAGTTVSVTGLTTDDPTAIQRNDVTLSASVTDNGLPLAFGGDASGTGRTFCGSVDEFRLLLGTPSEQWTQAEYGQVVGSGYVSFGTVLQNDTGVRQNRILVPPSLSKTEWAPGEEPPEVSYGAAFKGEFSVAYYDRATGLEINGIPSEAGDYRAVFSLPETDGYSALTYDVNFRIVANQGVPGLAGNGARVLLANDDTSVAGAEVESQSYDITEADAGNYGYPTYWKHDVWEEDYTLTYAYYNFFGGTRHELFDATRRGTDGEHVRLWDLFDVRIGNTFRNARFAVPEAERPEEGTEGLQAEQNYLPWNPDSMRPLEGDYDTVGVYHEYAANLALRNSTNAWIVSSCYTDGVGTVYFDAVNGWNDDIFDAAGRPNYRLVLEVCTNVIDGSYRETDLPPTDDNIDAWYMDESGNWVRQPYVRAVWHPVEMSVVRFAGAEAQTKFATTELTLEVGAGDPKLASFYRCYAKLDIRGPVRFRIRRTACDPDYTVDPDQKGLLLVDNVIASYPAPTVELSPEGRYDAEKEGKQVLGWEGAFDPPFPSATDADIHGRAKATVSSTDLGTDPRDFISAATMHYRWRYLDQRWTDWMYADLDVATLRTRDALSLPMLPGDVEFWFESNVKGTHYAYVDYSGSGFGLTDYTEFPGTVTNGWDGASAAWFSRVREGKSDISAIRLWTRPAGDATRAKYVEMEVTGDRTWRGYVQTTNAVADGLEYRFEVIDAQTPCTEYAYSTNAWYVAEAASELPATMGVRTGGTTNDWGRVPCDGTTGYLLFQLDDEMHACTVVHADYQNFNLWHDARRDYFVGNSTADESKKATSPYVQEFKHSYAAHKEEVATNSQWEVDFHYAGSEGYADFYEKFLSSSYEGWDLGEGMYVHGAYRDPATGGALQMAGQGRGHADFVATGGLDQPRGLESVSFDARIAQDMDFSCVAYPSESDRLKNYAFFARCAFDDNRNSNFTGNASISLVAHYRPGIGFYEARWEQEKAVTNTLGWLIGPAVRGQRLSLYKWTVDDKGQWRTNLLATTVVTDSHTYYKSPATSTVGATGSSDSLLPFFICVNTDSTNEVGQTLTRITAGVGLNTDQKIKADGSTAFDGDHFMCVGYCEKVGEELRSGAYGAMSANCEAKIVRPQYYAGGFKQYRRGKKDRDSKGAVGTYFMGPGEGYVWGVGTSKDKLTMKYYRDNAAAYNTGFDASKLEDVSDDLREGWWNERPGRLVFRDWETEHPGETAYTSCWGLEAVIPETEVLVQTAPEGTSSKWTTIDRVPLSGFGKPSESRNYTRTYYSATNVSVRVTGAESINDNVNTDIVVDNIALRQWAGADSEGATSTGDKYLGDFAYTAAWSRKGAIELNARRTTADYPCSIRSPLMDGNVRRGRGSGLGMFSFDYRNATPNIVLLLQIATNGVSVSEAGKLTASVDDARWVTVRKFDYYTLGSSGTVSYFLGLHGVTGLMRVIVDPECVKACESYTDKAEFGSIEITRVICRDEPAIDRSCWWGWNMRTLGDSGDTELRMYLPDTDMDPPGLSGALNNSTTSMIDPGEYADTYEAHMPFIQSPSFTNAVVGEVMFKARKYDLAVNTAPAEIRLYGTASERLDDLPDLAWEELGVFVISNATFANFSLKTPVGANYRAFRFAVAGVKNTPGAEICPSAGGAAQRVLIDEIVVMEAIRARLAFKNVGAFRSDLEGTGRVPDVPSKGEQPLCGENWGIQAELYSAMLSDEIDKTFTPRVKLHWFVGLAPWGYENWKDLSGAKSGYLAAATDTNWVYRSSMLTSPGTVMEGQSDAPTVVQYTLEVEYRVKNARSGSSSLATNFLSVADGEWTVPSWYYPVDYNRDYGDDKHSAAFCILDNVAPGWAWINEVNLLGEYENWNNGDRDYQYVEVAAPLEADISQWQLRFVEVTPANRSCTTNRVATFGASTSQGYLPGTKTEPTSANMVFHVVASPLAKAGGRLDASKGEIDGAWDIEYPSKVFLSSGELAEYYPVEIQLVRPSGIIEHDVLCIGTNVFDTIEDYTVAGAYKFLKKTYPDTQVICPGDDAGEVTDSLGVFASQGESADVWNNTMGWTPGKINVDQTIDPDHPTPQGESVLIYASVDTSLGHIYQTCGDGVDTTETQILVVKRNGEAGTNITYRTDRWFELGSVVANGKELTIPSPTGLREWTINVGRGATANITLTAKASVDKKLVDYGLTEDNPYTPAALDWLVKGETLKWGAFEGEDIALAKWRPYNDPEAWTWMTLTQMYWLDIDPTAPGMVFTAGVCKGPEPIRVLDPAYRADQYVTNTTMSIFMMITNETERLGSKYYGQAWSPYVLRGLQPGYTSWDYDAGSGSAWTSVTFKAQGILANGLTSVTNANNWVPLRWFVFREDSFWQPEDEPEHARFTTLLEVADPVNSPSSPGYGAGWYDWVRAHGPTPVYYGWQIGTKMLPFGVEVLNVDNSLEHPEPSEP